MSCKKGSMTGKKHSIETRLKMSLASKGKPKTENHKKSISKAKKEKPTRYWLGKKRPSMTGENNCNWNGGTSRGYKTGYYSAEYIRWRKSVFERDNYTCQNCKTREKYITAHHIKSFAKFPDLRFDLSNGMTLCEECHKLTDNYKGKNKNK